MWKYVQKSGEMFRGDELIEIGYAGRGNGKNNPDMQCVKDTGPIPRGWWTILSATDQGPTKLSLPLTPDTQTDTCGRSAFYVHGDSISNPGTASRGCIILPRSTRRCISESGDTRLQVISGNSSVNGVSVASQRYMNRLALARARLRRK